MTIGNLDFELNDRWLIVFHNKYGILHKFFVPNIMGIKNAGYGKICFRLIAYDLTLNESGIFDNHIEKLNDLLKLYKLTRL